MEIISQAKRDLEFHLERVTTIWYKTAENILLTSKMLIEAENELSALDYRKFKNELASKNVMSLSTISKLRQIGKNAVLSKPEYLHKLPQSYETLYILTGQEDDVIEAKIINNEINASSERKTILSLFKEPQDAEIVTNGTIIKNEIRIKLNVDIDDSPELIQIIKDLKKLQDMGLIDIIKGI